MVENKIESASVHSLQRISAATWEAEARIYSEGPAEPSQDAAADISSTGCHRLPTTNKKTGEWGEGWDQLTKFIDCQIILHVP